VEALLGKEFAPLVDHLVAHRTARVQYGGYHAKELDARVEPAVAHQADRIQELLHALQSKVLTLQRQQHAVSGGQRVDREQSERGWAIYSHEVVVTFDAVERALEPKLALIEIGQLDVGSIEVRCRRKL